MSTPHSSITYKRGEKLFSDIFDRGRKHLSDGGQKRSPEDVSTHGLGQGEGPVGSKLSRSDDADDNGRGRSGGRIAAGTEFLRGAFLPAKVLA